MSQLPFQFQLPPPSVALTQFFSLVCHLVLNCERPKYPSPLPPSSYHTHLQGTINNNGSGDVLHYTPTYRIVTATEENGSVGANFSQLETSLGNVSVRSPNATSIEGVEHNSSANNVTRLTRLAPLDVGDSNSNVLDEEETPTESPPVVDTGPPLVRTKLGDVEGYRLMVVSGREVFAFEGIPYAMGPTGKNRFRPPIPHPGWNGSILEAKDPGPECIQLDYGRKKGSEDCLKVHIYTPKIPKKEENTKLLPVIIFIHGGLFIAGGGARHGPAYLLEEDVILATFNYRLGIMGAFSTGDEVASGNWGLKDQALAINWVHEHISSFGGDPRRITLMGQSAGAVSTHLQLLSRHKAKGQINSAILMSGCGYNFWGLNDLDEGVRLSNVNARLARCPTNAGSKQLLECMQNVDADVLVANQIFTMGRGMFPVAMIEPDVPGAFLSETPDEAYLNGNAAKVPLVSTVTSDEANIVVAEVAARGGIGLLNGIFDADALILLGLRGKIPYLKGRGVIRRLRKFYGLGPQLFFIPRQFFTEVGNARYFTVPFHKGVQMHSQIAPTYAGIFNYTNTIGVAGRLGLNPQEYGVTHADDLPFIFNSTKSPPIGRSDMSFAVTRLLINLYTNFASSSNGTPSYKNEEDRKLYSFWTPVEDPQNVQMLRINEDVRMIPDPYGKVAEFWESLGLPDTTAYERLYNHNSFGRPSSNATTTT